MPKSKTTRSEDRLSKPSAPANEVQVSERVQALYRKAVHLLESGRVREALEAVRTNASSDPALKNLFGVCLLRAGQADDAVKLYRQLVMSSAGLTLRPEAPVLFKLNFATALALNGQVAGAVSVLDEIADESHPGVQRLREAIAVWRSSLPWHRRLLWRCGLEPQQPFLLGFDAGRIS